MQLRDIFQRRVRQYFLHRCPDGVPERRRRSESVDGVTFEHRGRIARMKILPQLKHSRTACQAAHLACNRLVWWLETIADSISAGSKKCLNITVLLQNLQSMLA